MSETVEIISLGGCGGFGMNATLFRCGESRILVDFGIGFPHEGLPGVERLVPDPAPLLTAHPKLDGIFLSHAHDDHVGAVGYLPPRWKDSTAWGTPFTLAATADRVADSPSGTGPDLARVAAGDRVRAGAFEVEFVHVAHSTPQSCALAIDSPAGTIVHTGDLKLDPAPVIGPPTDLDALTRLGRRGVRLLMLDSTGALRRGRSGSETTVARGLCREVAGAPSQVFCTLFSSHVDRVQSLVDAARGSGRRVALLGRRLQTVFRHGVDLSLIDSPAGIVVSPEELARLPPSQRLWLVGGCQGELSSSMTRLSFGDDSRGSIVTGDTVVFSSSIIPGNEPLVLNLIDRLIRLGAEVIHADEVDDLHVSGHGSRDELREIVEAVAPRTVMPIHGSRRHMEKAAALAREAGVAETIVVERGEPLEIARDGAETMPRQELPPRCIDATGRDIGPLEIAARRRAARGGVAVVFVRLPAGRGDAVVDVELAGLPGGEAAKRRARARIIETLDERSRRRRVPRDEEAMRDFVRQAARRALSGSSRQRPLVIVHLEDRRSGS